MGNAGLKWSLNFAKIKTNTELHYFGGRFKSITVFCFCNYAVIIP